MGDQDNIAVLKSSRSAEPAAQVADHSGEQPARLSDLESRNESGETALLVACGKGDVARMKLLAEAGCDTAAMNSKGMTALMNTAGSGVAAAVRAALDAGWCELEARDKDGNTAFLYACHSGSVECMELLMQADCDIAATGSAGVNALMNTAHSGVAAAVRAALAAGWCELEARDKQGGTAFLYACNKGSTDCMGLLLGAGCDATVASSDGSSAVDIAQRAGNDAEVQYLHALEKTREAAKWEEKERKARVAEAELMAMLQDGKPQISPNSVDQAEKARRKKEKRRRQQQAKREAAARRAPECTPEPEPEPEPQSQPDPEPEPELALEPEPEPGPNLASQPEPEPGGELETEADADYTELRAFLAEYNLTRHYEILVQHEVSFDALVELAEPDLQEIGLAKGPRVKMMKCAAKFSRHDRNQLAPAAVVPDEFYCPISQECMRDPVIVMETGMTYEREAIVEWLSSNDIDPSTGVELGQRKQLAPNVALRKLIAAWQEGHITSCE